MRRTSRASCRSAISAKKTATTSGALETNCHKRTVEKANDVGEIHAVVQDDIAVDLQQRQGNEQHEPLGNGTASCADALPHQEDVIVDEF